MSYADRWTDEKLADLEEKISRVYSDAQKDFEKQSRDYFDDFAKKDEEKRKKVESGELSKDEYKQWRLTQMGRGERLNHMARQMAERATKANEVAVAYVNDTTPGIYSLNRNHEAYIIEGLGHEMVGADFSLYNEQAVRQLIVEDPDIMPYYPEKRAVARGIDLAYGQDYIKRHIIGGIIQGKSVYKIADDLQRDLTNMSRASAVRTARTAITAAQNGGRQATMDSARAMGIKLRKRWVSAKDARVRDVHGIADGQTVPTDDPFIVGGEKLMFPGDSTSASGWNLYNCRCGMRTVEKEGIEAEPRQVRVRNPETGRNEIVNDMTYTEWAKMRGLSSGNKLTSSKTNGKIKSKIISDEDDIIIGKSVGAKSMNYVIKLPDGEETHLTEGTRITNVTVIAGKGRNREIDIIDYLVDTHGGSPYEWQKKKGIGYVDYHDESYKAELHWYEEPTAGKHEWKVKPDADGNWFLED